MGMIKFRNFHAFRGPVTVAGCLGLAGILSTTTGPNTTKGGSSTTQFFGRLTIASGAATGVVSTTIVKSDDWFSVTPVLGGTTQNSGGVLCVQTVKEGAFFTVGYVNGGWYGGGTMTACWEIRRVG